jgi:hypothetical protein
MSHRMKAIGERRKLINNPIIGIKPRTILRIISTAEIRMD